MKKGNSIPLLVHSMLVYRDEGQIWVALSNAVGAGILLLIPGRPCATNGHGISNKQYVLP